MDTAKRERAITVAELIEALKALPPEALVLTEGCDCFGPCCGTKVDNGVVVIARDDRLPWPEGKAQ